jgi:enoyl-CoA hydratase/carnithine racemase
MKDQLVISRPAAGLLLLTMNGTGKDNTLGAQFAAELASACREINLDTEIRVVIISGPEGKPFCTLPAAGKKQASPSLASPIAGLCCPVIAAVNGKITGQALELALACDIRVASRSARFSFPGITRGIIPADGATQRLPRLVGRAKAMELLLTGEPVSASEALRIGLINKLVTKAELQSVALEMGREMAGKATLSLQYCKEAVLKGLDMTLEQGLRLEGDLYYLLHTTQDRTEGIMAFREKRKPVFKGK